MTLISNIRVATTNATSNYYISHYNNPLSKNECMQAIDIMMIHKFLQKIVLKYQGRRLIKSIVHNHILG